MKSLQLGCVIPTYRQKSLLERHVPAVLSALRRDDMLTIIEDGQDAETLSYLQSSFQLQELPTAALIAQLACDTTVEPPLSTLTDTALLGNTRTGIKMQVLQTKQNQRFAGAVNLAVAMTPTAYIGLLNNDVSPAKSWAEVCTTILSDRPDAFGVGCLEYSDEKKNDPSGRNKIWFEKGLFQHSRHPKQESGTTAWVSGGSGVYYRDKWMQLGGFDLDFAPAYWEDIDLSYRARERGWESYFTSETYVLHKHESTHKDVFGKEKMMQMSWKNGQTFTWKHAKGVQKLAQVFWWPYWTLKQYQARTSLHHG